MASHKRSVVYVSGRPMGTFLYHLMAVLDSPHIPHAKYIAIDVKTSQGHSQSPKGLRSHHWRDDSLVTVGVIEEVPQLMHGLSSQSLLLSCQ